MPMYAAVDFSRVPSAIPGDVDVYSVAANLDIVQRQLNAMASRLATVEQQNTQLANTEWPTLSSDAQTRQTLRQSSTNQTASGQPLKEKKEQATYMTRDGAGNWTEVVRKKPPRKITGQCNTEQKIKAAAKEEPKAWHVFVGRLDADTTDSDLEEFLSESDVTVISCRKLLPRVKWQEKYAAFRLSVAYNCRNTIFEDIGWPLGADVRDWVFTGRKHDENDG